MMPQFRAIFSRPGRGAKMDPEIGDPYPRLVRAKGFAWGDGGFTMISPGPPGNHGPPIADYWALFSGPNRR